MRSPDEENQEHQGPVVHDRRRIDPVTGQVRDPDGADPQRGQPRPGRHSAAGQGTGTPRDTGRPDPRIGSGAGPWPGPEFGGYPGGDPAASRPAAAGAPPAPGGQQAAPGAGKAGGGQAEALATSLAERTADLQRLQAEYANYRKRVERDRLAVREQALANVLTELLPMLDDIGRAREHGELVGGFKSVADSMESAVVKLGLTTYGEAGDPFDPKVHEALTHSYSADVTEPTCVRILQPGYKVGDRILRPALVAVAEPGDPAGSEHEGGDDGYAGNSQYAADDAAPSS
jgi:molecular chaperone GrpE